LRLPFFLQLVHHPQQEIISALAKKALELEHLGLYMFHDVRDTEFIKLLKNCSRLRSLNLTGSCLVTFSMIQYFHRLENLNLTSNSNVDDVLLTEMARHLASIKKLDLSHCKVTTTGVSSLLHISKKLEVLVLSFNCKVLFSKMDLRHTYLRSLSICQSPAVTNACVQILPRLFPNLEQLDISHCAGIYCRATLHQLSLDLPSLKSIHLSCCYRMFHHPSIGMYNFPPTRKKTKSIYPRPTSPFDLRFWSDPHPRKNGKFVLVYSTYSHI
jgi:hypothetical protein